MIMYVSYFVRQVWSFSACISVASVVVRAGKVLQTPEAIQGRVVLNRALSGEPASGARLELSQVEWDLGICGLDSMTTPEEGASGSELQDKQMYVEEELLPGRIWCIAFAILVLIA